MLVLVRMDIRAFAIWPFFICTIAIISSDAITDQSASEYYHGGST